MTYEELKEKHINEVKVKEHPIAAECELLGIHKVKGLYKSGQIAIDSSLSNIDKKCTLGIKLGHHYTTSGNILDLRFPNNAKQKRIAREWCAINLINYNDFLELFKTYDDLNTIAYHLEVDRETLDTFLALLRKYDLLHG